MTRMTPLARRNSTVLRSAYSTADSGMRSILPSDSTTVTPSCRLRTTPMELIGGTASSGSSKAEEPSSGTWTTASTGKPMPDAEFMLPVRPSASWRVACCPSSETQVSRATVPSVTSSMSMLPNLAAGSDASVSFRAKATLVSRRSGAATPEPRLARGAPPHRPVSSAVRQE